MELDFGRVKNYRANGTGGFGFVEGFFDTLHRFDRRSASDNSYGVFFYIKKIKDKDMQNILKANEGLKKLEDDVYLWYAIEKTDKDDKDRVKEVYRNVRDIPEDILFKFLDKIPEIILKNYYNNSHTSTQECLVKEPNFYSQLFADLRIPDDKLDNVLKVLFKKFILKCHYEIKGISDFSFIRESQKKAVKLILENDWGSLPKCVEDLTRDLQLFELTRQFGDEQYEALFSNRLFNSLKVYHIRIDDDDRVKELTIKILGEEQYNALLLEREDALKERQEVLKKSLFKSWKDKDIIIDDSIKLLTIKTLGKEQYNALLSERQESMSIPVDSFVNQKDLIMKLDFGWIKPDKTNKNAKDVTGFFSSFRMENVTHGDMASVLKQNADIHAYMANVSDVSKRSIQAFQDNVCFWYIVEKTEKGDKVKNVFSHVQKIPTEILFEFIDNINESLLKRFSDPLGFGIRNEWSKFPLVRAQNFCPQLFEDKRIPDDKLQKFIAVFNKEPQFVLSLIKDRESLKEAFEGSFDLPTLTKLNDEYRLAEKYRVNSAGIRHDMEARELCLICGSSNNVKEDYRWQVCRTCIVKWYVNHCWNCHKQLDERDSETPKCKICGFLKCTCGACTSNCEGSGIGTVTEDWLG
jgi:hypothetical protein